MGRLAIQDREQTTTPTIAQLRPWHRSMARMMVAGGKRPGELAVLFGITPTQISVITNSPLFLAELNRMEAQAEYEAVDMRTELEIRQGIARETVDEHLTNKEHDIKGRVNTALEILDRTGYGKKAVPQKHVHFHAHKEVKDMSDEELRSGITELLEVEVEG